MTTIRSTSLGLLMAATLLTLGAPRAFAQQETKTIPTRFGALQISDMNALSYRGRPFAPPIEGEGDLNPLRTFVQGDRDIVLVQDNAGTACPAQLVFVTVRREGVRATPKFGSCSDSFQIRSSGDGVITVTMPGHAGPFEPPAEQRRAAARRHVFVLAADGTLTENGKPVPTHP
ncbi:hypothetical protein [Sphaerotilus uruguayifluvii]|uniref:Uncharacterized protein n=1 Tax=Sphaerotilus uruguayifluvii TaxID=2735897 RepID=A0ABX2G9C5_9BURK|nr:hypothetical protein [Leptothrix sp. C29]NRT58010.1 hypothetical protein [Leptothrix sp. C29]